MFVTGPLGHQISYDYVYARDGETDEQLVRRAKQQVKYQLDWTMAYYYLSDRFDNVLQQLSNLPRETGRREPVESRGVVSGYI